MSRVQNNTIFYIVLGVIASFVLGYIFSSKKKEAEAYAVDYALQKGIDHVKTQSNVTKNWFNSLSNYWKQVWKK